MIVFLCVSKCSFRRHGSVLLYFLLYGFNLEIGTYDAYAYFFSPAKSINVIERLICMGSHNTNIGALSKSGFI